MEQYEPIASSMHSSATKVRLARRAVPFVIGAAITFFWLAMMFSLLRDRILPERRAKALAAQSVSPSTFTQNWSDLHEAMFVSYADKRVGALATTVVCQPGQSGGYRADMAFGLGLSVLDVPTRITMNAAALLDPRFNLSRFHLQADLGAMKWRVTGAVDEDFLLVQVMRGTQVANRLKFRLDRQISFLEAIRPLAARSFEIKPGNSIIVPVVDPVWSMQMGMLEISVHDKERIRVAGKEVEAFKVESRLNDFVSTSWVNARGETLRRQLAGGLVLERAPLEQARAAGKLPKEPVRIPTLDARDFAKIPAQPLSRLADEKSSPLSILNSFTR